MNIDLKENDDGDWFYSFAIEKGVAPQTLLAVVGDESPTTLRSVYTTDDNLSTANDKISEKFALPENINVENAGDDRAKAAKEIANRTLGKKVYTKADAADTVNEILEKTLASGDMSSEYIGKLSGKSKNAVINFLYEQMNTAPEGATSFKNSLLSTTKGSFCWRRA